MKDFLNLMYNNIGDKCKLCEILIEKINNNINYLNRVLVLKSKYNNK